MRIQQELREKGQIEFEGATLKYAGEWQDLKPGDLYVAQRNGPPQLLTVKEVKKTLGDQNQFAGAVFATDIWAYPFDLGECVKVECVRVEIFF